jgi:hypothetical protein
MNSYNERYWKNYSSLYNKYLDIDKSFDKIPNDITNTIVGILGEESAKKWIHIKLKAFNMSAVELVKTEKGTKALKAFLLRMPI